MGLDTSHDCWHGSYGAFHRWRMALAKAAGLPPLELMEGFYEPLDSAGLPTLYHGVETREKKHLAHLNALLPIVWSCLKPDPLHKLLHHSDCDGEIAWEDCGPIADSLENLISKLPQEENWRDTNKRFIAGLRRAAARKESVEFH